jgi:CO/xanthine dehydrogenase FAD-binding subunit
MSTLLQIYECPTTLEEALALLARTDLWLRPLAGGVWLTAELACGERPEVEGVVDLRRLGLDAIYREDAEWVLGATATLAAVAAHADLQALAGGLLRRVIRGEGAINFQNMATVGGLVARAQCDSEFYAALLALGATVEIAPQEGDRRESVPLAQLAEVQGIITAVRLPLEAVQGGHARLARTPSDRPIVAACAVAGPQGTRVAFCGVAARPLLEGAPLDPPDDFKGSAAYRLKMIEIMRRRALADLQA